MLLLLKEEDEADEEADDLAFLGESGCCSCCRPLAAASEAAICSKELISKPGGSLLEKSLKMSAPVGIDGVAELANPGNRKGLNAPAPRPPNGEELAFAIIAIKPGKLTNGLLKSLGPPPAPAAANNSVRPCSCAAELGDKFCASFEPNGLKMEGGGGGANGVCILFLLMLAELVSSLVLLLLRKELDGVRELELDGLLELVRFEHRVLMISGTLRPNLARMSSLLDESIKTCSFFSKNEIKLFQVGGIFCAGSFLPDCLLYKATIVEANGPVFAGESTLCFVELREAEGAGAGDNESSSM